MRRFASSIKGGLLILALCAASGAMAADKAVTANAISFKEDVLPILQYRCMECHKSDGEGYKKTGLNLSNYEGIMKGAKDGPVIVPGDIMTSNLLRFIEGKTAVRMPHNRKPLSPCERKTISDWVGQGAKNN